MIIASPRGDAYASVALARGGLGPLTYRVPPEFADGVRVGSLIRVPLSRREEIGIVLDADAPPPVGIRVKDALAIASPGYTVSPEVMELGRWLADYYCAPIGEALACVSMVGFSDTTADPGRRVRGNAGWRSLQLGARVRAEAERLDALIADGIWDTQREASRALGITPGLVGRMLEAGVLVHDTAPRPSGPYRDESIPELNQEQAAALGRILDASRAPRFEAFLLFGVTGSGKTEVYLRAIEDVLARGGTALCLVPEISLTPQTVQRFESRFRAPVGVFHSQMTRTEKRRLLGHVESGAIRIVIGARSAIFAPMPRLGIIIVDEEHEGSYKQAESPRYHARDVALIRARRLAIPVVMGSATPSLEAFENARRGKFALLPLPVRAGGISMPTVRVVDLANAERIGGTAGLISTELRDAIRLRLERGEQSLLLLNRRGFSNFLFCPSCRWVARCKDDDVALTLHRRRQRRDDAEEQLDMFRMLSERSQGILRCHFCGHTEALPPACPGCGNAEVMAVGSGTQRIEEELHSAFPGARILRMDLDTVGNRQAFLAAWQRMVDGDAQIILGTQMIAKGLHLERVTLVGAVLADVGLFLPDFRAEERTFFLLSQVAGRSGRASDGEVIFQSFMPHHTAVRFATAHDYTGFFEHEMKRRNALRFPPVTKLIAITLSDEDEARCAEAARLLAGILRRLIQAGGHPGCAARGPLPAPLRRLGGRWRERILLRGEAAGPLHDLLHASLADPLWKLPGPTRLVIDVDPVDLL